MILKPSWSHQASWYHIKDDIFWLIECDVCDSCSIISRRLASYV